MLYFYLFGDISWDFITVLLFLPLFLSDTDEELKEWKNKFEERIALLESKISKLEREMNDTETKSSFLKQTINEYIWEISKLQTEAEVIETIHILSYSCTIRVGFISDHLFYFTSGSYVLEERTGFHHSKTFCKA